MASHPPTPTALDRRAERRRLESRRQRLDERWRRSVRRWKTSYDEVAAILESRPYPLRAHDAGVPALVHPLEKLDG